MDKCKECIVKGCQFDPVYDGMKFRHDCIAAFRKHKEVNRGENRIRILAKYERGG